MKTGEEQRASDGWTLEKVENVLSELRKNPAGMTGLKGVAVLAAMEWMVSERRRIESEVKALNFAWDKAMLGGGGTYWEEADEEQEERETRLNEEECGLVGYGVDQALRVVRGEPVTLPEYDEEEKDDGE